MTLLVKTVPINTDASGDATATVRAGGCRLHLVDVAIGDLESFDLTITEEPLGASLLGLEAVEADGRYPVAVPVVDTSGAALEGAFAPPAVLKRIQIVVANGGNKKSGELTLLLER